MEKEEKEVVGSEKKGRKSCLSESPRTFAFLSRRILASVSFFPTILIFCGLTFCYHILSNSNTNSNSRQCYHTSNTIIDSSYAFLVTYQLDTFIWK